MADITLLPSAKVPLIYDGELTMTTEWYRFFWNIYGFTGTGVVPVNKGGTGLNTIGDHQLIIGNANNVFEPASLSSASINISYPAGFINLELGTSGVTPGTYGSASQVGVFTVNAYGVLTAASNTSIGIDASQVISGTLPVVRGGTGQSTYTDGQLLIGNSTGNTLTKATLTAGTGVSVTNGAGSITIANTGVLSVSGTSPVVSSGGATPAISMAAANTTTNGYLTSTDWNTFNNKAPATSGTSILYGNGSGGFSNVTIGSGISFVGGTLSATGTGGTVTSVTGTNPVVSSGGTTPAISLATAYGDTLNPYASKTANYFLAAPNGTAGVPTFRAMVAADVPALAYVTSVSGTGTVNGITLTGTVTSSGSLTLGGTLSGIGNSQLTNSTISGVALGGNLFSLTAGTGVSFSAGTTYNGSAAITINATGTGGTVTSVAALTLGTTGTDLSSTVANSTTTPVITLNVPTASALNRGALSAADWTTFNSKAPGVTFTTGYVPFGQGTTTLNQDAALFWDNTNKRLGLGTTSPVAQIANTNSSNAIGNANLVIRTTANDWGTILLATPATGVSYNLRLHNVGATASDYALGISSGSVSGTGSFVASIRGNGEFHTSANLIIDTSGKGLTTNSAIPLGFGTNTLTNQMTLFSSGGLSLGNTTDPGAKNLSVSGTTVAVSELSVRSTALNAKTTLATKLTTVGTSATEISPLDATWGNLSIVTGLDGGAGNFFTDLVFTCVTSGPTVLSSKAVSGSPAARTYSMSAGNKLQLAMASGSYDTRCAVFYGLA